MNYYCNVLKKDGGDFRREKGLIFYLKHSDLCGSQARDLKPALLFPDNKVLIGKK